MAHSFIPQLSFLQNFGHFVKEMPLEDKAPVATEHNYGDVTINPHPIDILRGGKGITIFSHRNEVRFHDPSHNWYETMAVMYSDINASAKISVMQVLFNFWMEFMSVLGLLVQTHKRTILGVQVAMAATLLVMGVFHLSDAWKHTLHTQQQIVTQLSYEVIQQEQILNNTILTGKVLGERVKLQSSRYANFKAQEGALLQQSKTLEDRLAALASAKSRMKMQSLSPYTYQPKVDSPTSGMSL